MPIIIEAGTVEAAKNLWTLQGLNLDFRWRVYFQ
jgi:hypothetical protein